jgi:hypothetical protein
LLLEKLHLSFYLVLVVRFDLHSFKSLKKGATIL